jgi:hypothetical protein
MRRRELGVAKAKDCSPIAVIGGRYRRLVLLPAKA